MADLMFSEALKHSIRSNAKASLGSLTLLLGQLRGVKKLQENEKKIIVQNVDHSIELLQTTQELLKATVEDL